MGRILTGAWIETCQRLVITNLFTSHPHGCVNWNKNPSKCQNRACPSHPHGCVNWNCSRSAAISLGVRRILTGAWIETCHCSKITPLFCRILTGAWIETIFPPLLLRLLLVASSRVRELKPVPENPERQLNVASSRVRELKLTSVPLISYMAESHPHGCVNWNIIKFCDFALYIRRILTGAWIETSGSAIWCWCCHVASSRVRELKQSLTTERGQDIRRILTGAWIETLERNRISSKRLVASSRVRELKHNQSKKREKIYVSHPHGCVNWNSIKTNTSAIIALSHPHGCVNWNTQYRQSNHE